LHKYGLDALILSQLKLPYTDKNIAIWEDVVHRIQNPKDAIQIGIIGDTELQDAYKSVYEALAHAGIAHQIQVHVRVIDAQSVLDNPMATLEPLDGIVVTGELQENLKGQLQAVTYAREKRVPFLGIDTGLYAAAIEFARNVLHLPNANATEMDATTTDPIVVGYKAQDGVTTLLGEQECRLDQKNCLHDVYPSDAFSERFRNNACLNAKYVADFNAKGLRCVGVHEASKTVVACELESHPWFIAVQFHPQFHSKPYNPHPLLVDFARACLEFKNNR
jgi:CTP synthase